MANATQVRPVETTPPGPPGRRTARLPGVDGIRALAVTAVLVYHLSASWLPGGYLGVDVFFVISGYLITRLLVAERAGTGRISLRHFWLRRARRILPPLFPMLLATVVLTALVHRSALHQLRTEVLGALTYTSNWVQIAEHHSYFAKFGDPSVLQHLWSLAVEEQFYLIWPLVVVLILLRGRRRLALVAGLGAIGSAAAMAALFQPGGDPSRVYFGTDTHASGLLIGAVLAIAWPAASAAPGPWPRRRLAATATAAGLGAAGIGLGFWLLGQYSDATYRGGILAVSAATAVLIVGTGHGRTPVGALLALRPVRWLGARSYGLYLWHWPVLVLGDRIFAQRTVIVGAIEVSVAVLLAAGSYRFIERPVLTHGYRGALSRAWRSVQGRTSARRGGLITAAGATAALCVFAVVTLLHAPAAPVSGLDRQLAAAQLAAKQPPAVEPTPDAVAPSPSASPSPAGPPPGNQISALGDSVMLAASPALRHQLPGIQIDAKVSRAMQKGPGIISGWAHRGALRPVVLLGLGTNGPFPADMLEGIIGQLGPDRTLYLVNVYLPTRPWGGEVNHTLTKVASGHTNVHLIDWRSAAGAHQNLLWPDRIHPRPGAGADLYARTVVEAMSTPMRAAPPGRVQ
ncbi:acyltransferase family protein [Actinocatenispora sera]|uniref:acyltransferase family protein n=1 Tax=Actinocatenispora sera TaxID=390989 RepID=UPI0033CF88D1